MQALLTGAGGFLGAYLLKSLQEAGYAVTALSLGGMSGVDFIQADITKAFQLPGNGFDRVVHAAGKAHVVPRTEEEKKEFYAVNVEGTRNLLNALDALPQKPRQFVFISTVGVYGADSGENIAEDAPLNSKEPYGITKIQAEEMLREWGERNNVPVLILRLPLVVGRQAPGNLRSMLNGMRSGKYFRIGKGQARKSMVLAADVANLTAAARERTGTYNLTDGVHPSFADLEDALSKKMGKSVKKLPYGLARLAAIAGDTAQLVLRRRMPINSRLFYKITQPLTFSDQKARRELNWQPRPVLNHIDELLA